MNPFILVIFLSLGITLYAQNNNTSILFKKGAELEYKSYDLKPGSFSKKNFFEITRLIFTVQDVRDSNNIKYSYITKKGINPNNEKLAYEKKYVLTFDGNKISMPIDFYNVDTVYFSNVYPGVTRDKGFYSSTVYKSTCTYNFPTDLKKDKFMISGNGISVNNKVRDYETTFVGPGGMRSGAPETSARIVESTRDLDMTIKKYETKGSETMATAAGNYECNKVVMETEMEFTRKKLDLTTTLYYNTEMGLIKSETQQSKLMLGYTELVRVKK